MANCSVACGQVTITAQNEKMVETIHKSIFGVTCRFAYYTIINGDEMEVASVSRHIFLTHNGRTSLQYLKRTTLR